MPYLKTDDGCSLYYELLGDGPGKPTLTFLNGTLQTTIYWKLVSKSFTQQFRVLLYDARGQGESDLGQQPLSLERHVADLQALLFELNIHQTHMVGLSHGARVALAFGQKWPDSVLRMVLCSTSARSTFRARVIVRTWHEILRRHSLDAMVWASVPHVFGHKFLRQNEKVLERIVSTIVRRNKTEALRAHLEAMQNYAPITRGLQRHPFLVLVLTGEDDPLVTAEGGDQLAEMCGGRHMELKGVGHSLVAEDPQQFTALVSEFLSH